MKKRLVFIIPILILLGFLAIKPPAIGSEKKEVVVTPTSTTTSTPTAKPNLRDFGDDGSGPAHHDFDHDGDFHSDDLHQRNDG